MKRILPALVIALTFIPGEGCKSNQDSVPLPRLVDDPMRTAVAHVVHEIRSTLWLATHAQGDTTGGRRAARGEEVRYHMGILTRLFKEEQALAECGDCRVGQRGCWQEIVAGLNDLMKVTSDTLAASERDDGYSYDESLVDRWEAMARKVAAARKCPGESTREPGSDCKRFRALWQLANFAGSECMRQFEGPLATPERFVEHPGDVRRKRMIAVCELTLTLYGGIATIIEGTSSGLDDTDRYVEAREMFLSLVMAKPTIHEWPRMRNDVRSKMASLFGPARERAGHMPSECLPADFHARAWYEGQ